MTREYNEDYAYDQQARDSQPDHTPFLGLDGKTMFTKTRPMRCPWCRATFYVNQAEERPLPPYENPEPPVIDGRVKGMRNVCGHPKCWDLEQRHQLQRSDGYQKSSGSYYAGDREAPDPSSSPKRRLQKLGANT